MPPKSCYRFFCLWQWAPYSLPLCFQSKNEAFLLTVRVAEAQHWPLCSWNHLLCLLDTATPRHTSHVTRVLKCRHVSRMKRTSDQDNWLTISLTNSAGKDKRGKQSISDWMKIIFQYRQLHLVVQDRSASSVNTNWFFVGPQIQNKRLWHDDISTHVIIIFRKRDHFRMSEDQTTQPELSAEELVDNENRSSLAKILSSAIGVDITRITIPVSYNEPTSFIMRIAEATLHNYLLKIVRLLLIRAFVLIHFRLTRFILKTRIWLCSMFPPMHWAALPCVLKEFVRPMFLVILTFQRNHLTLSSGRRLSMLTKNVVWSSSLSKFLTTLQSVLLCWKASTLWWRYSTR